MRRGQLAALKSAAKGRRRGLIVIYGNPDPDALGGAWALKKIFKKWGTSSSIVYTGEIGRPENQALVEFLRIPAARLCPEDVGRADLVAVVDAQPAFFPAGLLPRIDIVFDHHPRGGRLAPFSDIRPACLATSSILTEYLRAARCRIDRRIATALYYGIITDARNSGRQRSRADSAALELLARHVDRRVLRRIECSSYSLDRLDYFAIAIIRLRHHRGAIYVHVGPVPSADVCAQIADFLIRVKEANWALVSGVANNTLVVVFRSDGQYGNAGESASSAFGRFGSAGGHETMGRAEIGAGALPDGMLLTQSERIERFILNRLSKTRADFGPMLRDLPRES